MSKDALAAIGGRQLTIVRELGGRRVPTQAAHWGGASNAELVVVQQWRVDEDEAVALGALDAAQALARVRHPNFARVRDAVKREGKIALVSDWIDGVTLTDLYARAQEKNVTVPFGVALRIVLDVLAGLTAIHGARDRAGKPLTIFHGALSPDQVIVGSDGIARVLSPSPGAPTLETGGAATIRFAAPELLLGDETADARVDVYSAGVMLWETLAGKKLFEETTAGAILTRHLAGKVESAPSRKDPPWAESLGAIAQHAIATDPGSRTMSAADVTNEVRKHAGLHLPRPTEVASLVESIAGDTIASRREVLSPPGAKKEVRGPVTFARKPMVVKTTAMGIAPPIEAPPAAVATPAPERAPAAAPAPAPATETKTTPAPVEATPIVAAPAPAPVPVAAPATSPSPSPSPAPVVAAPQKPALPAPKAPPPSPAPSPVVAPVAAPVAAATAIEPPKAIEPPPRSFEEIADDEVEIAPPSAPLAAPIELPKIPPLTAPPSVAEVADRAAATTPATLPLPDDGTARKRRRGIVIIAIALCVGLLLVVGVSSLFGGKNEHEEGPGAHASATTTSQPTTLAAHTDSTTTAGTTTAGTTSTTSTSTAATNTTTTAAATNATATATDTATATTTTTAPTAAVSPAPPDTTTTSQPTTTTAPVPTPATTKSTPKTKPTYDPLGI
jgi:serine/threonine-protein kinase